MMYKVIVFAENKMADYVNNPFVDVTKKTFKDECLIWDSSCQKDLEYFAQNKDHRIYEKVLDYCYENNPEFLYIIYLHHPEYLIAELNIMEYKKKFLKTKIIFGTDWRLTMLSDARIKVTADLLQKDCIHAMVNFSNLGPYAVYPGILYGEVFYNNPKVKLVYSPFLAEVHQTSKQEARKKYNLPQNKFIFLYFGSMYYGKGLDILLKAMKRFDHMDNVLLFVSAGKTRLNYDLDFKDFEADNIIWRAEHAQNNELSDIYAVCDVVVLPYRKTYTNCGSSVLIQSCSTHKPVIMPEITPYKQVVTQYNLGHLFEPENEDALFNAMCGMRLDRDWFDKNAKFDEYISKIQSWAEYIKILFEEKIYYQKIWYIK
jgi:glycosyltransferase involved in cell wall biosynthesis